MKLKALIIDDEPLAIKVIETYLQHFRDVEVVATCQNVMETYHILAHQNIDLIFLDIQMPMLTGLEFIKSLENPPMVIIITAYRDFAVESFELDVIDYLVKPVPLPRFLKALNKAVSHKKTIAEKEMLTESKETKEVKEAISPEIDHLFLKVDKKMVKVFLEDILYIESLKDYIKVKTRTEELIVHQTLTGITDMLPSQKFLRIHRSFTVALNKIKAIDGNCVEILGKLLPIGRNYIQEVKDKILH